MYSRQLVLSNPKTQCFGATHLQNHYEEEHITKGLSSFLSYHVVSYI
ncbi:hypothetical protein SAMN04487894_12033 [Niabella drilacis]|uniref:Uncharacterized protein n=1 Tax=Niabella drilacis (strain DSM 25811 / CCM 8410 / CCUG 62505 / LMG 26954 / E90) TaxID=1285928 RepID=A0A1G7A049_NIADE|nr:hypothetical protein SAMN04487894_12033 [Niabella drilacis]